MPITEVTRKNKNQNFVFLPISKTTPDIPLKFLYSPKHAAFSSFNLLYVFYALRDPQEETRETPCIDTKR